MIRCDAVFFDGEHAGHLAWYYALFHWAWCTRCGEWVTDAEVDSEEN
jgi:hypothetical protein